MKLIMVLGYLGSGKTTFVLNALRSFNFKTAVIVNDFGARDVDGVILHGDYSLKKIYDGSIFCTCKSDKFVDSMLEVISETPEAIIVEASGLSNPHTMLRELSLIEKKGNVKFETNVFTIVSPKDFEKVASVCHAVKVQVAQADVVVLNKLDLVDEETSKRVEKLVRENTRAEIIKTTNSTIDKYYGYKVAEKQLPALIEDLTLQKVLINVGMCKIDVLDQACKKLSTVCHRLKGIVTLDNKKYVYEYVDGGSKLKPTKTEEGDFLVALSALQGSLKKSIEEIIKDYDFLDIE